jgi:CRP-like cAMP-binding protein
MKEHASEPPPRAITADNLREIGLFGGLSEDTLRLLAEKLPAEVFGVGLNVVREGDSAREMFVVIDGELEVSKTRASGAEVRIALLGPGDWFGEMSILDVQPRSASVRALAPSTLVRISTEHVDQLLYRRDLKAYSLFLMNVARELSRRLRVADGILSQFIGDVTDRYVNRRG